MEAAALRQKIMMALRTVVDVEVPINIVDLGLVYDVEIHPLGLVTVRMTLTAPSCPVAQEVPAQVEAVVGAVAGVTGVAVELVWDPPWDQEKMSDDGRWQLAMM